MRVKVLKRESDTALVQITPVFWRRLFGESAYCISLIKCKMPREPGNWWYAAVSGRSMPKAVVDALDREDPPSLPRAEVLR